MLNRAALALVPAVLLLACGTESTPPEAVVPALEPGDPVALGFSEEGLADITATLQAYVDEERLPGAAAMVLRDGRIAYAEAVGMRDVEAGAPLVTDAIFRIASQTKAIVSVGVMMLQEEGKLSIDDPVAVYLPTFTETTVAVANDGGPATREPASRLITVRDLLTHTAGIGYGYGPASQEWESAGIQGWYFADREEPIRATIDRLAQLPMDAHPGERFVYGYGTDILGAVVEQASGQPLDSFLQERIFDPLGMEDTHFYLPPEKSGRLAVVYNQEEDRTIVRAPDGAGMQTQGNYVEGPRRSFSGGAGLTSTAEDYARFLQMLLNGGSWGEAQLLSGESVTAMTSNQSGDLFTRQAPGMSFGLGFSIHEDPSASGDPAGVGTFGWGGAYHSTYWVDPVEGLVVVYFTQVIPAAGLDDHARLRGLVYAALTDRRAPD